MTGAGFGRATARKGRLCPAFALANPEQADFRKSGSMRGISYVVTALADAVPADAPVAAGKLGERGDST